MTRNVGEHLAIRADLTMARKDFKYKFSSHDYLYLGIRTFTYSGITFY